MAKRQKRGKLNPIQTAAKNVYGGGDYAHHETMADAQDALNGDGLYTFIMRELADDGGPMTTETAIQRMESAQADIQTVIDAINKL